MDVDIDELRLAYDERINRMIPTPAGTVVYTPAMEGEEGGQESRFSKVRRGEGLELLIQELGNHEAET